MLKPLTPLSDNPEFVAAFSAVVSQSANMVCAVCGLGRMGHGPELVWLGYKPHVWEGTPATADMLKRADELTSAAYAANRANGTHSYCGHRYAGPACRRGECIHIDGHCANCE